MLVIADETRPVAVAGVMGGADTEVQDDTRNILLECAVFDARSVRATRRALGLNTDASYRFERGVDPAGMMAAAERAVHLIRAVAGGDLDGAAPFAGRELPGSPELKLRLARVTRVLGVPFDGASVATCLEPLGFGVREVDAATVSVHVPGHRRFDVAREVDLIEEIARRHGYDEFPDDLRAYRPSSVPTHPLFLLEDRLRALLVGRGMLEARTAAFVPETDGDVELMLPLSATESRLRRSLVPGLLRRVEYNFARGARSIRLFEIGTTFAESAAGDVPVEATRLAVVCTGHRQPPHWSQDDAIVDVWDVKALADDVAAALGSAVHEGSAAPHLDPALSFRLAGPHDQAAGSAGRVMSGLVDAPAWAGDIWVLEVELPRDGARAAPIRFAALPQHPGIERDLALLIGAQQSAAEVGDAIRRAGGALLVSAEPFDLYSGPGVPENKRSIGWRLQFRAPDRTLTDAEVDAVIRIVLERLNEDLGVEQRA
jgi:phenylalanyl-tRNA synthetase beta chain